MKLKSRLVGGSKGLEQVLRNAIEMSPSNIEAIFELKPHGGGELLLRYCGPLAHGTGLFVRFGERRDGREWVEPRDVAMVASNGEATAVIPCAGPVEGACFAFFAQKVGAAERVWDNAGKSFGYYTFDATTGKVATR